MLLIKYLSSFDLWLHHLLEMHGNLNLFCVTACVCSGGRGTYVSQKSWFKKWHIKYWCIFTAKVQSHFPFNYKGRQILQARILPQKKIIFNEELIIPSIIWNPHLFIYLMISFNIQNVLKSSCKEDNLLKPSNNYIQLQVYYPLGIHIPNIYGTRNIDIEQYYRNTLKIQ